MFDCCFGEGFFVFGCGEVCLDVCDVVDGFNCFVGGGDDLSVVG